MKAILSGIHGNLEALQAVLTDIARHDIDDIYCLGDTTMGAIIAAIQCPGIQSCKIMPGNEAWPQNWRGA